MGQEGSNNLQINLLYFSLIPTLAYDLIELIPVHEIKKNCCFCFSNNCFF